MGFVGNIIHFFIVLAIWFLLIIFFYGFIKSLIIIIKNKCKRKNHNLKFKFKHKLYHIREARYIKIVDFAKMVLFDVISGKDYLRLFGIWAFTGYYGEGKTMGCLQFAKNMQKNYPHRKIKIFSNINIVGQTWVIPRTYLEDGTILDPGQKLIKNWREILNLPKNSIFIYDESQADYSCNMGTNAFPDDLLRRITQVRKKQFAMFMTSPRYNRMNINIRESVNFVIECKNILQMDRWFRYSFYRAEDYEDYRENKVKLRLNRYLLISFVVHNIDYRQYNTIEEVESIKEEENIKLKKPEAVILDDRLKKFRNEMLKEVEIKLKSII